MKKIVLHENEINDTTMTFPRTLRDRWIVETPKRSWVLPTLFGLVVVLVFIFWGIK